jgi:hypothetical protein
MFKKLTVYKNCDPRQPQSFAAQSEANLKAKLAKWMDDNNGEDRKPCQVDGLSLNPENEDAAVLEYSECYHDWEISQDGEIDSFATWGEARDDFISRIAWLETRKE